jgi:branched-chain amino acid transport system permease protein
VLIYMLQTVVLIQLGPWLTALGQATGIQFLANLGNVRLTDYTFFIYGIILVLFMLFRPEGLIPSARRRAELRPETAQISEAEQQAVYDTRETQQAVPDVRGGGE